MPFPTPLFRPTLAGVALLCLVVAGCSPGPTTWKVGGMSLKVPVAR